LHLPRVRQYVLRIDGRAPGRITNPVELPPLAREGLDAFQRATSQAFGGRYAEAKATYLAAIDAFGRLERTSKPQADYKLRLGTARNNLAWLLATCPDPSIRDPAGAVAFVGEVFVVCPVPAADPACDGAFDIILGHGDRSRPDDGRPERDIGVGGAAAGFGRDNDFAGELREQLAALGIGFALLVLDAMPFAVS